MKQSKLLTHRYTYSLRVLFIISLFLFSQACRGIVEAKAKSSKPSRNINWATPIEKPGLPNFHQVTEDLYRGAQPSAEGMRELKKMGINTVVNLRSKHSDLDELGDTGLGYEHIPMTAWRLKEEDVVRFLQIVTDKDRTPVFVHCQRGADRTGVTMAAYRIIVEGWTKEDALEEMKKGGFGFNPILFNLVSFIKNLDVDGIKRRAGL
jgi:protein tyrosine/serine phosphatase